MGQFVALGRPGLQLGQQHILFWLSWVRISLALFAAPFSSGKVLGVYGVCVGIYLDDEQLLQQLCWSLGGPIYHGCIRVSRCTLLCYHSGTLVSEGRATYPPGSLVCRNAIVCNIWGSDRLCNGAHRRSFNCNLENYVSHLRRHHFHMGHYNLLLVPS